MAALLPLNQGAALAERSLKTLDQPHLQPTGICATVVAGDSSKDTLVPPDKEPLSRLRDSLLVLVDAVDRFESVGNPGDVLQGDADEG